MTIDNGFKEKTRKVINLRSSLSFLLFLAGCEMATDRSAAFKATSNSAALTTQGLNEYIGWIHGSCLAIRNGKIMSGTKIQIVVLDNPQKLVDAKVTGITESNKECYALLSDRAEINKQDGRYFYSLATGRTPLNTMAIGLVSEFVKVKDKYPAVEFDLKQDGTTEHAGNCLTSEGVQFYISAGSTFDEKALWSDYYYLGYDTKPTCH